MKEKWVVIRKELNGYNLELGNQCVPIARFMKLKEARKIRKHLVKHTYKSVHKWKIYKLIEIKSPKGRRVVR